MPVTSTIKRSLLTAVAVFYLVGSAVADVDKYQLWLPDNTKGYVSIRDVDRLVAKWSDTQYGRLFADPVMKPFTDDLRQQILGGLDQTGIRFGISIKELDQIANGSACVALIELEEGKQKHALVLMVDTKERENKVNELFGKIDKNMEEREATKESREIEGTEVTIYEVPIKKGSRKKYNTIICRHGDYLVAVDHVEVVEQILGRIQQPVDQLENTLASVEAFAAAQERCQKLPGSVEPDIHWFIEPFGCVRVLRSLSTEKKRRGNDMLGALLKQGFDALQGLGGFADLTTVEGHELLHRTYIHAPPLPGAGDEKFALAGRMLAFIQTKQDLSPQDWVAADVASYRTLTWDLRSAFEYLDTLVDEIAGEKGFYEDLIDSLKNDPNGPQIDVENQLIAHLGDRLTYVTDCVVPITPQSQRFLFAIDLNNPKGMAAGIDKAMESDPDGRHTDIGEYRVWEILSENEEEIPDVVIDGGDFDSFDDFEEEEEEQGGGLLNNASFAVVGNYLLVSSHIEFIEQVIEGIPADKRLRDQEDFKVVTKALNDLGAGTDSMRFFSRNDEELRTTYELIRDGKMPESETILGRILNKVLAPEEKGVQREQQIDGKNLPGFEVVGKYFGPSGLYARIEDAGFIVVGCFLTHQVSEPADDEAPASEPADDEALAGGAADDGSLASEPADDEAPASEPADDEAPASEPADDEVFVFERADAGVPDDEGPATETAAADSD